MRIAICSAGELFGGVERHILGLLETLRSRGHSVALALFYDGELAALARTQGTTPLILGDNNFSAFRTSRRLAAWLDQERVDVVHCHGYKATVYCAMATLWHKAKLVKTEHGLPETVSGKPFVMLREQAYWLMGLLATHWSRATVCYVTNNLMDHYQTWHYGLSRLVIHNGVSDISREFLDRPSQLNHQSCNLLIVGRLEIVKGHRYAIEALASIGRERHVEIYCLGVGPCESDLRTLAEKMGVGERVHFVGYRRDVYEFIAHCDILLLPSLHEGLPYTLLEAMTIGIPVIASNVGGLAEALVNMHTALLTPPRDVAALADAILMLCDDTRLRRHLTENARTVRESAYSLAAMTDRYSTIYETLCKAGHFLS